MMRYFIPILLLLLLLCPTAAQGDNPLTVYRAEDLFTENLTILERKPIISYNPNEREIYYFDVDSESWLSFPYPEDFEEVYHVESYYGDKHVFAVMEYHQAPTALLLDVRTGEYSQQELPCGEYRYNIGTDVPHSRNFIWVFRGDELCKVGTGERIPIPDSLLEINEEFLDEHPDVRGNEYHCLNVYSGTTLLPDERTILVPVCTEDEQYLYAYDAQTLDLRELIHLENVDSLSVVAVIGNETIFVQAVKRGSGAEGREISLYRIELASRETELVLEKMNFAHWTGDFFDVTERQQYNALQINNDRIRVYSYDFSTGDLTDWGRIACDELPVPCDELMFFRNISSNGDYVMLQAPAESDENGTRRSQSYLLSTKSGKLIYTPYTDFYFGSLAGWVSPTTLFYYHQDSVEEYFSAIFVELDGDTVVSESEIEQIEAVSETSPYILYWGDETRKQLYVLNTETEDRYLLLDLPSEARADIGFQDDGSIQIYIQTEDYPYTIALWHAELHLVQASE